MTTDSRKHTRRRFFQTVGGAAALVLAGCASNESTTSGGADDDTNSDSDAKMSGNSKEKHLSVALEQAVVALDPVLAYDFTTNNVTCPLWDTLIEYSFDDRIKLQKALATEITQISDTTYEYTIEKERTFHNGDPITASDVKASYERVRNPNMASPKAWTLRNLKEGNKGINVVDETTIQFNLKKKSAVWKYMPAFNGIAPKSALEKHGKDFGRVPGTVVGSGPLKVVTWNPGVEIKLKPFNSHPQANEIPHKTVTFQVIPEGATRVTGLKTGELDVVITTPPQQWDQVKQTDVASMHSDITFLQQQFAFQNQREPWKSDKKLRKALAYATDWNKINDAVFYGHGSIAKGPLPPNMKWHNDKLSLYDYNPEKAKQLYEESDGINRSIKYITTKGPQAKAGVRIQQKWKSILGIDLEIRKMPYDQLLPLITSGDYDILYNSFSTDYPDPDGMLFAQYHSTNFPPNNNESWYENKKVDKLLEDARYTLDPTVRKQMYKEIQKLIYHDVPCIWGRIVAKGFGVRNDIEFPPVTPLWFFQDIISGAEY